MRCNMAQWTSKLFVFADEHGQECIATALPAVFEKLKIRVFQAAGPYVPIGWPRPAAVGNASEWMKDLEAKGFRFEPSSVE
jgi:hypothetical protein